MTLAALLNRFHYRQVRLILSWLIMVVSAAIWVLFEFYVIAEGEPRLVTRLSLAAMIYEAFNAVSINTDD